MKQDLSCCPRAATDGNLSKLVDKIKKILRKTYPEK